MLDRCSLIPSDRLVDIVQRLPALRTLHLGGNASVTNDAVREISTACTQLQVLNLTRCDIGDDALELLPATLTELQIGWCKQIRRRGLGFVAARCPQLRVLSAPGCDQFGDSGLMALAQGCAQLRVLNVRQCNVGDRSVTAIAAACSRLEVIKLNRCRQVTDASLQALGRGCPMLREVVLADLDRLTDDGLAAWRKCQRLQVLGLQGCTGLTPAGLQHLRGRYYDIGLLLTCYD